MTASLSSSEELEEIVAAARACRACIEAPRGRPLPHEPRPVLCPSSTARLLIASQAPGLRVHTSGRPFTDASGDRLRAWLGLSPEVFYDTQRVAIVAMGFCFPGYDSAGGDLPPRRECRSLWHDRLFAAMPQVECVLMIGRYAQEYHLHRLGRAAHLRPSLTETVARWRDIAGGGLPRAFPLPHPSWRNSGWVKRHAWFTSELLPELRAEVARLV